MKHPRVKMIDKISFTFGVVSICSSEWLVLRHHQWFPLYYLIIMTPLLMWRLGTYTKHKYQLFMLGGSMRTSYLSPNFTELSSDFCYFVNLSVLLQALFFRSNMIWFKANYVLSMGPVALAIIAWNNSLVFHSLDKLTSFYLHTFPPVAVTLLRWDVAPTCLTLWEFVTAPLGLYLTWQLGYWVATEILLRQKLEGDKELMTSLRWLATDQKNKLRNLCLDVLVKLRVGRKEEALEIMDSLKAKTVYSILYMVRLDLLTNSLISSYFFRSTLPSRSCLPTSSTPATSSAGSTWSSSSSGAPGTGPATT